MNFLKNDNLSNKGIDLISKKTVGFLLNQIDNNQIDNEKSSIITAKQGEVEIYLNGKTVNYCPLNLIINEIRGGKYAIQFYFEGTGPIIEDEFMEERESWMFCLKNLR